MTTHGTRSRLHWLLPCVATLVTLASAQLAQASLSFAITTTAGTSAYTNVTTGTTYTMIVYAMIQDSTGSPDPTGNDGLQAMEGGLDLTNVAGTLTSNVAFSKTTPTGGTASVAYQTGNGGVTKAKGTQLWSSGGVVGIGASNTATSGSTTISVYGVQAGGWTPQQCNPSNGVMVNLGSNPLWSSDDATAGTYASLSNYPGYTAIPFCTCSVYFTGTLAGSSTASANWIPGSAGGSASSGQNKWYEAGVTYQQNGNNDVTAAVGTALLAGTINSTLLGTVTFSTSAGAPPSYYSGRADITGQAASPNPILAYSSLASSVTGTLTNTGYSGTGTQDTVSWSVSASATSGVITASNAGAGLAPSSGTALSFAYTAPANFMGPVTVTLTPSGTGANATGAALTTGPQTVAINVVGAAARAGTDGNGVVGTYGTPVSTASLTSGTNLAGIESTLGTNVSNGIGMTTATILAGSSSTGGPITMAWRSRTATEAAGFVTSTGLPLYSDVVNISGIGSPGTSSTANTFALQMSYALDQIPGGAADEDADALHGLIYLGFRDPGTNKWTAATTVVGTNGATQGDSGLGSNAYDNGTAPYIGTWAQFVGAGGPGNGYTLAQLLGSWGVDTADHAAWSVIDHDAEFAVVPEPGTLALLAAGVAALGIAYRRRKAAKV